MDAPSESADGLSPPPYNLPQSTLTADDVLMDSASSHWLKSTLRGALARDPVDALNDALVLAAVLEVHLRNALGLEESD